jgi:phytoene synthase
LTSESGAPPGSLRYFAVLFAPPAVRPVLDALYGFEAEIRATVEGSSHEAAHARLQWWRAEIDRLVAGHATHPHAIALQPLRENRNVDLSLLHEALVGADLDLARLTYRNWQELEAYCYRAAGALQTVAAAALAGERSLTEPERRFARQLGSALRQAEMIRDLRRDMRNGRQYLPIDALEAAGLDPTALHGPASTPALESLLGSWRSRVGAELASLPRLLPERAHRSTQRPGLVLGALHEKLLAQTASSARDPDDRAEVRPMTRLWTAWRTAVRYS